MKSGINLENVDLETRVQDDLYRHVNGKWLATFHIPDDRASDGVGYALFEQAERQVREIVEESTKSAGSSEEEKKIGALFASFMDTARIEELAISPIKGYLERAKEIVDGDSLLRTLSEFERDGLGGLFSASVYTDHKKSDENILYLSQGGLSLPDEAYYREEEYLPIREAFLLHIEKMFEIAGIDGAAQHGKNILELETSIAASHWDQVKDRDATLTYNKMNRSELDELGAGINWSTYLVGGDLPPRILEKVVVREPDFFKGLGLLLENFEKEKWISWLQWQVLTGAAPYLHDAIVQQNFSFYGTTLSGTPKLRERWKRAISLIEGSIGEAVGKIYVQRHFPPESKIAMEKLVANLVAAYRESISALDWMSAETKEKALEKLNQFTPKIGYPNKWRDYSSLSIKSDDLFGNIARISLFSRDFELAKIGAPVDKDEWYMTPQTVNAYYNPGMNEIVFPAAILQPPFFDISADDAANYGGVGAIIGHEIGHGFDDQGSKYDGLGNLKDWWTQSDRDEFEKRAKALIAQYDVLAPAEAPDVTVNGALTVGENIGDLGGLTIAYKAYLLAQSESPAPTIDSLTGAERFFFAWAQAWRGAIRPEALRRIIATDPHSPNEFRCNQVVRNMDVFYETFNLTESDAMFLPSHERIRIW